MTLVPLDAPLRAAFPKAASKLDTEPTPAGRPMMQGESEPSGRDPKGPAQLRQLILAGPEDAEAQNSLGLAFFSERRTREAAECFQRAIALDSTAARYHENLGMALQDQDLAFEAAACYRKALFFDPNSFMSLVNMACLMHAAGQRAEAEHYFQRATTVDPNSFEAHYRWALALFQFEDMEGAAAAARRAIELRPEDHRGYEALGAVLRQKGFFKEAIANYERALSLNPQLAVNSFQGIVASKKITSSDIAMVERMQEVLAAGVPSPRMKLLLHMSLGKALDDLTQYGPAMEQFAKARVVASSEAFGFKRLDRKGLSATTDAYRHFFTKEAFSHVNHGLDSDLPILIVGMPRSGTTLLEQIISSHPEVGAGGELSFWRMSGIAQNPRRVFDPKFAGEKAIEYRRLLRGIAPKKKRVTDKMPLNHVILGPFHVMFPNARIIHCRRHPVDTCLSILMNTMLLESPPDYALDLEDTVFFYQKYLRQMDHWRQVLPACSFLEVDYEELVSNREATTRRIVEFCALEWDDACLHHEANERPIATPSKWQVRQPIYATSVDRWRRYAPWLGPLRKLLTDEESASLEGNA